MAFDQDGFYNQVVSDFLTTWNAAHSGVPIALQNQNFDPPQDGGDYGIFKVIFNIGRQASHGSIGNRLYLNQGFLILELYIQRGDATDNLNSYCKTALNFFRDITTAGIMIRNPGTETIGALDSEAYFQTNVQAEFEFDEIT